MEDPPGVENILSGVQRIVADIGVQAHKVEPAKAGPRDRLLHRGRLKGRVQPLSERGDAVHQSAAHAPHREADRAVLSGFHEKAGQPLRQ